MRELVLKMSMSADGYVGGPAGEVEWIFASMDETLSGWMVETLWNASLHAMGRRTYDDMVAWWPTSDEVYAPPMNEIPKVVFTRRGLGVPSGSELAGLNPIERGWRAPEIGGDDLVAEVTRLKQENGKPILAHGGARLAQALAAADLIDEYRLVVHPAVLGEGLRIFPPLGGPRALTLTSSTAFPAGAVVNVYRRTG